jgi:molecular chaperone GrpE
MKKINKKWERIKRMSNDEELIFGADEEPVNNENDNSSVEDAAASDKASAETEETKAEEAKAEEAEAKEAEADEEDDDEDELPADNAEAVSDLEARYMSLYAEYDNYRKRTQKEKDNLYADAIASVTKDFLTLIDNLDRATEGAKKSDENSLDKVIQGMELVGRQAQDTLKKIGVEEIPAERGTKFDPNLHEAMMHIDDEELGEQEIAMVFAKGYKYKDRVIRHAQVQVAN